MTRRNKRYRNKSSPQTTSSPKKQRSHTPDKQPGLVEQTESDISDLSNLSNPSSDIVTPTPTSFADMATADQSQSQAQTIISQTADNSNCRSSAGSSPDIHTGHPDESASGYVQNNPVGNPAQLDHLSSSQMNMSQTMVPPPVPSGFISQPAMETQVYMPPGPHMNFPQQMLHFPNQLHQMPQPPRLSDDDILRVATQMKSLLRDEINDLVDVRVAQKIEPLKNELAEVKKALSDLQRTVSDMSTKTDDLEQYSRRSCLRISGIAERDDEDVTQLVLNLANRVGADIDQDDIDRAHRVGRKMNAAETGEATGRPRRQNFRREIIVKFHSHGARLQLLKGRAKLREERANIYINEDLTKFRRTLFYESRQLKKNKSIKKTWVYGGNVYIQDLNDSKLCVTSFSDLEALRVRSNQVGPPRRQI